MGFESDAMWGPLNDAEWGTHDPYALAEHLKGVSLYVSSGSGLAGPNDIPSGIPGVSTNWAGMALEVLSRVSSLQFVAKLNKLSIPVQVNYRPSGTHSWPYWDFEMRQSWPQAAAALGWRPPSRSAPRRVRFCLWHWRNHGWGVPDPGVRGGRWCGAGFQGRPGVLVAGGWGASGGWNDRRRI